jgi:outer membrane protein assembly factor BamB|tara:strand:- start:1595 stop:2971 length:1377 start_codon:yes stop_codon:yes gene_type:complete
MKKLLLVYIVLILSSCSFDNKTGIWKDASSISVDNKITKSISTNPQSKRYEEIFTKNQTFDKEKEPVNFSNIKINSPLVVKNWPEQYISPFNNISNFSYSSKKILLSKSSKLRKISKNNAYFSNKKIIFYKNNLISYDHKGTIYIYSPSLKKKIFEYNFYKKNFKNFEKEINLIINNNILFASDNLGYMYAININNKDIVWAKNYGIPFRSNLKFANNQIFLANQDNVIYSVNSNTGEKNWEFATSLTFLKSDFENNFALDLVNNVLFFLNTSGELYSIDYITQKIKWVLNFKNASLNSDTQLFLSQPIVIKNNILIITTEKAILSYDTFSGLRNWIFSAESAFKPIITSEHTYSILKNNLLVCLDNLSGSIIWSKNIFNNIDNKKIKKNFKSIIDFKIVNNIINIYSNNGHLVSVDPNRGSIISSDRISRRGISSEIFFLDNKMLFVDNNNRLLKFN